MNNTKELTQNKGITLIALVITIIVMLILVGVTISIAVNGGLFNYAKYASERTNEAIEKEKNLADLPDGLTYYDLVAKYADESVGEEYQYQGAKATEEWNGEIAESFAGGNGTKDNPYKITNGAELAYFSKVVNGEIDPPTGVTATFEGNYISIENSINLGNKEFMPIGKGNSGVFYTGTQLGNWEFQDKIFNGFLDGKGNCIVGLKITQEEMYGVGLIGALGALGKVENLKILEGNIVGRGCVGGIVGASKGIINNCVNKANVTAQDDTAGSSSGEMVGGIVGVFTKGSITNCRNDGEIIGKDECMKTGRGKYVGGIVGYAHSEENTVISNCENTGKITTQYQQAGGIVGSTEYVTDYILTIENCKNSGKVEAKAKQEDLTETGLKNSAIGFAGGIIGWAETTTNINNCTNSGEIIAMQLAGGIAGTLSSGTINNCTNSGKIEIKQQSGGGIAGKIASGTIINCTNSGKVTEGGYELGGIAGKITSGTIINCTNSGEIIAAINTAGGIAGELTSGTIRGCTNSGKIEIKQQSGGGIAGKIISGTIINCTNSGEILASGDYWTAGMIVGGIVGNVKGSDINITRVYNSGKVTATENLSSSADRTGGIVGTIVSGPESLLTYAYNKGEVSGGDVIGQVAGRNNVSKAVSNCYYYEEESELPGIGDSTKTPDEENSYLTGTQSTTENYNSLQEFLTGIGISY